MPTRLTNRDLFGGAITAQTPSNLTDVSDLRQVPDTQEVFVYENSNTSIVTEILERVDRVKAEDIAKFHFDSLAHDNGTRHSHVLMTSVIQNEKGDATPPAIVLKGEQRVPKFNQSTPDRVLILMAVFRVEDKNIDVVVTFNIPLEAVDGGAVEASQVPIIEADFDTFVKSFQIVDFGLFA